MKILVIDTADQMASCLTSVNAEITCLLDEIQSLNAAEKMQPSLILLNYAVQDRKTPDYVRLLLEVSPKAKLVVLGDNITEDVIIHCVLSGAKGYQELKQFSLYCERLVRAVIDGEAWLSRKLVAKLIERIIHRSE